MALTAAAASTDPQGSFRSTSCRKSREGCRYGPRRRAGIQWSRGSPGGGMNLARIISPRFEDRDDTSRMRGHMPRFQCRVSSWGCRSFSLYDASKVYCRPISRDQHVRCPDARGTRMTERRRGSLMPLLTPEPPLSSARASLHETPPFLGTLAAATRYSSRMPGGSPPGVTISSAATSTRPTGLHVRHHPHPRGARIRDPRPPEPRGLPARRSRRAPSDYISSPEHGV